MKDSNLDLSKLTLAARKVVADAVSFIRLHSIGFDRTQVDKKGFNDLVSYVDKGSEQLLVDGLRQVLPGSGFIAEEQTAADHGERFRWIVDPLDGTTNFIHGVPCYAVSVALVDHDELIMGIVHEVNQDECFWSHLGVGSFVNDRPIKVSNCAHVNDSLVATGFPYTDFSRMDSYMGIFHYCMKNTHGIRRPGSASVDLAWLAAGRFDMFYEYGLNPWDVAAGAFLVQQAGGRVTDFKGGSNYIFGKEILASNGHVHNDFAIVIADCMN